MRTRVLSFLAGVIATLGILAVAAAIVGIRPNNIHAFRSDGGKVTGVYVMNAAQPPSHVADKLIVTMANVIDDGLATNNEFEQMMRLVSIQWAFGNALTMEADRLLTGRLQFDMDCGEVTDFRDPHGSTQMNFPLPESPITYY